MLLITLSVLVQMATAAPPGTYRLSDARNAQLRFESVRRAHLPRKLSSGSSGHCDARIGRFCYWYDSTDHDVATEHKRVTDARNELLAMLDSAARRNPSDDWIAGQRVRYLIEGNRWADAVAVARACRAESWWCSALEGLALHVGERYAGADSVYSRALDAMPERQRCAWLDLRDLAPRSLDRELSRASCAERAGLVHRLWTLSQPLWQTPGNDLRTEHFARHTMALVLARSANAHGMVWGDDSRQLLLRYGWAEWFTRHENTSSAYASFSVTGHDREPSYYFFPEMPAGIEMQRVTTTSWHLRDARAPTRYAPRHIKGLSRLPHQMARFVRGDSLLLAVAYDIDDTLLSRDSLHAGLAWLHGDALRWTNATHRGQIMATAANDTLIASIEVLGSDSRHAARARYTLEPLPCHAGWCLSDLLIIDPARAATATDPEAALLAAMPALTFASGSPVGVFWEVQGVGSAEPLWLSLTVTPTRAGLARSVARRLGLAREAAPVRLRWQATLQRNREGQLVTLRLPPTARGRYRVLLTVEPPGLSPLFAVREIEIRP